MRTHQMISNPQTSIFKRVAVVVVTGILLTACQAQPTNVNDIANSPAPAQKTGDTTKSGKVVQNNNRFYLQTTGQLQEIDSYSVTLADYVGQSVSATGQFSGDTLFVAKIQPQ